MYVTAIVHKEGDTAYGLSFPDYPGCFAAADSWDKIPGAATEALDLWFEGRVGVTCMDPLICEARHRAMGTTGAGGVLLTFTYFRNGDLCLAQSK